MLRSLLQFFASQFQWIKSIFRGKPSHLEALLSMTNGERSAFIRENKVSNSTLEDVIRIDFLDEACNEELTWRIRMEETGEYKAHLKANYFTLNQAIKRIGGLLTPRIARKNGDPLSGEFEIAQKESGKRVIGRFKNKGLPYDRALTELNCLGFNFSVPADIVSAIMTNDSGQTVYSH